MGNTFLTIGLPIYNQLDLIEKFLSNITKYDGDDIEILLIDDGSTDDVCGLISSFNDSRITYRRNEVNLGHDGNIMELFKHAKGEYLFLFRVRDVVKTECIKHTIETLKANSSVVYLSATALSEYGGNRFEYKNDRLIKAGKDALIAHGDLYMHPSGSIYKVGIYDYDELFTFIRENGDGDYKRLFLTHDFIRMQYAFLGDFFLQKEANWIYSDSLNAKDKAVNSLKKEYVYSPRLTLVRLRLSMMWAQKVVPEDLVAIEYIRLVRVYMATATYRYYGATKKQQAAHHYGDIDEKVRFWDLFKNFKAELSSIEKDLGISDKSYLKGKRKIITQEYIRGIAYFISIPFHNMLKKILKLV